VEREAAGREVAVRAVERVAVRAEVATVVAVMEVAMEAVAREEAKAAEERVVAGLAEVGSETVGAVGKGSG